MRISALLVAVALLAAACSARSDGDLAVGVDQLTDDESTPTGDGTITADTGTVDTGTVDGSGDGATAESEAAAESAASLPTPADADGGDDGGSADAADGETAEAPADAPPGDATATDDPAPQPGTVRPDWLGTRVLPTNADGVVPPQETPPEMVNRRYPTVDLFPTPTDNEFRATAEPVTDEVLARSTWNETCPVTPDELLYLRMSFWGFDDRPHLGEMIVHREVADDVVGVFRTLFDARFPIEEMRVTEASELDAPPTGDGNNTTSFVCRAAVGSARFSEHAFGLAVDINPFQNPYQKGDLVLPELSTSYLDRSDVRPGMILEGDVVVGAFDAIGWGWGGRWRTLDDYHHFSRNNR